MPLGENIKFKKRKLFKKTDSEEEKLEEKLDEKNGKVEAVAVEEKPEKTEPKKPKKVENPIVKEQPKAEVDEAKREEETVKWDFNKDKKVFVTKPYLLFRFHGSLYGFEANVVREVFWLPEVTPIDEAPEYIIGVVNYRGKIVPVMDLDLRLGRQTLDYKVTDSVIVLEFEKEDFMVGVIVNQVQDVTTVKTEQMEKAPFQEGIKYSSIIACDAKLEDDIVMLIDHNRLIAHEKMEELLTQKPGKKKDEQKERRFFCPNATEEERKVFKERAMDLMKSVETVDMTGLMSLAVVGLNGEYLGIDLGSVKEFWDINDITPIPCCPSHIIGSLNLRGDILTLVDIRDTLKMSKDSDEDFAKVVVLDVQDFQVGVPVNSVFDIINISPNDITAIPTALQSVSDEYLKGTAPYDGKMLSIIDIPKIFRKGDIIVSEEA